MTEQQLYTPFSEESHGGMEDVVIEGEAFKLQKGHKNLVETNGKSVVLSVDVYHHNETGMEIEMYSMGMDKPINQPTIIRSDYGCPCMNLPSSWHMQAHDCLQQRNLMFETMEQLGTGAIAVISEQSAAGNGHGKHAVHGQATIQYEAFLKDPLAIPTMNEAQSQLGYYDDIRRHDLASKVIKATIGERPALVTTSNTEKIKHYLNAGINVIPDMRVELQTEQSSSRQATVGRHHYDYINEKKPGAYLVNGHPEHLTPRVYQERFIDPPKKNLFQRMNFRRNRQAN